MRVTGHIPAFLGRVDRITVRVRVEGLDAGEWVDVTDVQLQAGRMPTGRVPHPSDLRIRARGRRWFNGVVPRSDEVIAMANSDLAAPTRVRVYGSGEVRVGSYRFGQVSGSATADGENHEATQGWGHVPVITERSDLHARVETNAPVLVIVDWRDRE